MSCIPNDIGKIWNRLFDHKGFLAGEIDLFLREFEQNRGDKEVDSLFKAIEDIADIKDTGINSLKETDEKLFKANQELKKAQHLANSFVDLEKKFQEDTLKEERNYRKATWEKFMDSVTSEYSKINLEFEEKEIETKKYYEELEKKLKN